MDKNNHRVARLRALVTEDGGPAEFARRRSIPTADKPIDPTYVSQVLNGHRAFGEKAAQNMEKRAGLIPGYFDMATEAHSTTAVYAVTKTAHNVVRYSKTEDIEDAVKDLESLPPEEFREARLFIKRLKQLARTKERLARQKAETQPKIAVKD